jgi:hypothetical protein
LSYPFSTTLSSNSITVFQFEGHIVLPGVYNDLQVRRSGAANASIIWQTNGDQCGLHYILQRSIDGINWQNRNSFNDRCNKSDNYQLSDDISGIETKHKIHYRIKLTDTHGVSSYSQVKSLDINTQTAFSFTVNPNPVTGNMLLQVANGMNKIGRINIRNMDGKKIMSFSSVLLSSLVQINLNQLPAGLYLVEMISENERSSQQIIRK